MDQGHGWVRVFVHAKENFVLGIIQLAEAREVLVRTEINTPHRFQQADCGSEIAQLFAAFASEEAPGRKRGRDVINQWRHRQHQNKRAPTRRHQHRNKNPVPDHFAPRALRSSARSGGAGIGCTRSKSPFFTRYSRPRQVILLVKNPASQTTAPIPSRSGTSHNFDAPTWSRRPQTPVEYATLNRKIR